MMCLFFGLYLSLTRVTFPEYSWDYQRIEDAGLSALIASVGFAVFLYLFWKIFPRTPMFNWLVLSYAQSVEAGYVVQTAEQERSAIGLEGEASSFLRPAGRGRFGDKTYSVGSRGDFIEKGRRIVIVRVEGNRYVVEEIPDKQEGMAP
jgi:membrane-bound serine protease (ClpP class)